jgi:hypothetical protein
MKKVLTIGLAAAITATLSLAAFAGTRGERGLARDGYVTQHVNRAASGYGDDPDSEYVDIARFVATMTYMPWLERGPRIIQVPSRQRVKSKPPRTIRTGPAQTGTASKQ